MWRWQCSYSPPTVPQNCPHSAQTVPWEFPHSVLRVRPQCSHSGPTVRSECPHNALIYCPHIALTVSSQCPQSIARTVQRPNCPHCALTVPPQCLQSFISLLGPVYFYMYFQSLMRFPYNETAASQGGNNTKTKMLLRTNFVELITYILNPWGYFYKVLNLEI